MTNFPAYFKPLLASPLDLKKVRYPLLVSPKLDGIRCLVAGPDVVSRNMKPIPNDHVRNQLANLVGSVFDGELITYTQGVMDDFNTTQSKIMAKAGEPDFVFHVFDTVSTLAFHERLAVAERDVTMLRHAEFVHHEEVNSEAELIALEHAYVEVGWEGLMARHPDGKYKFGRSTVNEQILLKLKRFDDEEALVIGYTERLSNQNEQTRDALGRAQRTSHKANMVPTNMLGSFVCEHPNGATFEVGTGFTEADRIHLWQRPDNLLGKTVKVKYQGLGPNKAPRFPVFLGFREDME